MKKARMSGDIRPMIVVAAHGEAQDLVQALDAGADDYLRQPIDIGELQARMRALIRRQQSWSKERSRLLSFDMNHATREINYKLKTCVLSPLEYTLLAEMSVQPYDVYSRSDLKRRVYGENARVGDYVIDWLIRSVRRRLDKDIIRNVHGAGWTLMK